MTLTPLRLPTLPLGILEIGKPCSLCNEPTADAVLTVRGRPEIRTPVHLNCLEAVIEAAVADATRPRRRETPAHA